MSLMTTLIAIFFSGILVGLELCAHYGFHTPTLALDDRSQIIFRQGAVRKLRWLVPAFFAPAAIATIALTLLEGAEPGFLFRCIAVAGFITWIFLRAMGTVPINAATLDWNADQPPQDWKNKIEKAEKFHIVGTWAALISFVSLLISVFLVLQ
jgi:hypothetical protein